MKSLQWSSGTSLLLLLAATALGQSNPAPTAYPPGTWIAARITSSPFLLGAGGAGHGAEVVKGSPFSADVVYEFTQALGDDNRIHRESHGKIFRDREGRIRNEIEDETPLHGSRLNVTINDPVSQTFVTLNPQSKRAMVNHVAVHTDTAGRGIGVGFATDQNRAAGTLSSAEILERRSALQQNQRPVPAATEQTPRRKTEELGTKEIQGFTASGMRFSTTIPAGEIGNEKPIVIVNETWWSEDLKAVLVSVYDDPQSGRRVMRLANLQAGEPDSQLFQIPADYTIQEFPTKAKTAAKPLSNPEAIQR